MSGYCDDYSMSNNAREAKRAGRMTASEFGKRLKVSAQAISKFLRSKEYHHTSSYFNIIDFYDVESLTGGGLREAIGLIKSMRAFDQERKRESRPIQKTGTAIVEYWEGSRNYPRRVEKTITGNFTLKGDWYILPDGSRKRKDKVKFV